MSGRESWNMARIAASRPLPKARAMHAGVVGVRLAEFDNPGRQHSCSHCGHHMCSCAQRMAREQPPQAARAAAQFIDSAGRRSLARQQLEAAFGRAMEAQGRQQLEREIAKLTPSERGNINVQCAELLFKHATTHANMLDSAGAFHKGERVVIESIASVKSGLVTIVDPGSKLRRSLVPASKLTW